MIFNTFKDNPAGMAHRYDVEAVKRGRIGDQAFIEDTVSADTFRPIFGPVIASYKCDSLQSEPPKNASIVMFHGLPKMHEITTGWVAEQWI